MFDNKLLRTPLYKNPRNTLPRRPTGFEDRTGSRRLRRGIETENMMHAGCLQLRSMLRCVACCAEAEPHSQREHLHVERGGRSHGSYRRLGLRKTGFLQFFAKRPPKTCPLDQFSVLITNMVSDFAGGQYFCMILTFKDRDPAF